MMMDVAGWEWAVAVLGAGETVTVAVPLNINPAWTLGGNLQLRAVVDDAGAVSDEGKRRLDAYAKLCPRGAHLARAKKFVN